MLQSYDWIIFIENLKVKTLNIVNETEIIDKVKMDFIQIKIFIFLYCTKIVYKDYVKKLWIDFLINFFLFLKEKSYFEYF